MVLAELESVIERAAAERFALGEPAHDLLHLRRVVSIAKRLCILEGARMEVVVPAAWLHDWVNFPKDHPRREESSRLSAEAAAVWLRSLGYPDADLAAVSHAIEAHSFSAGIEPRTVEAAVVQDADRLDALGAVGIARCFATAGALRRPFYRQQDPFCRHRPPDDRSFTVDHFYAKLLRIEETLRTPAAQMEGRRRLMVMREYLTHLERELAEV